LLGFIGEEFEAEEEPVGNAAERRDIKVYGLRHESFALIVGQAREFG
jgi:hypothetical protein